MKPANYYDELACRELSMAEASRSLRIASEMLRDEGFEASAEELAKTASRVEMLELAANLAEMADMDADEMRAEAERLRGLATLYIDNPSKR